MIDVALMMIGVATSNDSYNYMKMKLGYVDINSNSMFAYIPFVDMFSYGERLS